MLRLGNFSYAYWSFLTDHDDDSLEATLYLNMAYWAVNDYSKVGLKQPELVKIFVFC